MEAQPVFVDPQDAEKNKLMGILAYIIFFIPLLAAKDSKFAMYHANQGLVLFLGCIAVMIASFILAFIPFLGWLISFVAWIGIMVLAILGIINAAKGECKPLPLIGGITILK